LRSATQGDQPGTVCEFIAAKCQAFFYEHGLSKAMRYGTQIPDIHFKFGLFYPLAER
jgi:hypothetical protein